MKKGQAYVELEAMSLGLRASDQRGKALVGLFGGLFFAFLVIFYYGLSLKGLFKDFCLSFFF